MATVKPGNFFLSFKKLPGGSRQLLSLGIILALFVALPIVVASVSQLTFFYNRAASGEPATPIPAASPSPTPKSGCGIVCQTSAGCPTGLTCYQPPTSTCPPGATCVQTIPSKICRNPSCPSRTDCTCSKIPGKSPAPTATPTAIPTPPPTSRPFQILFRFEGVSDNSASFEKIGSNAAKVVVKFLSPGLGYSPGYVTPPVAVDYVGRGIYALHFGVWSTNLPAGNNYAITLKGEKHLAVKFCQAYGQTEHCTGEGQITIPVVPITPVYLDFTGISLEPGDLSPQDGVADGNDFAKLINLLSKPCSDLTDQDKLIGDLDYSGCVTAKDAFLMRQTLQTKYDEN